ncbi:ScbA/BarX family gamma-butyrolactone biosynthesis protein [Klugiella xanthotipulae]|nr:ScbA/BarX family gamma-butyrolactone biosynthesis protein [Klugiella xanthotipulae]
MQNPVNYAPPDVHAARPATQALRFEQTVARSYVHKSSVTDVLLTDHRRVDAHHYVAAAQWPRQHHFFRTQPGEVDILLVAETVQQATLLIAHAYYAVPVTHHLQPTELLIEPLVGTGDTAGDGQNVIADISIDVLVGGGTCPRDLRSTVTLRRNDTPIARGEVRIRVIPARTYNRIRGARPHSSVPEPFDGDDHDRSVIIDISQPPRSGDDESTTASGREWLIVPPRTQPVFFDGPTDQVPPLVLLEAARQAAQAAQAVCGAAGSHSLRYSLRGTDWVELDRQARLQLHAQTTDKAGLNTLTCIVTQEKDRPSVDIHMTVLPPVIGGRTVS